MEKLQKGMRVRFTSHSLHNEDLRYYPPVGTVGETMFPWMEENRWFVQWPAGVTMGDGLWSTPIDALEVVSNG